MGVAARRLSETVSGERMGVAARRLSASVAGLGVNRFFASNSRPIPK